MYTLFGGAGGNIGANTAYIEPVSPPARPDRDSADYWISIQSEHIEQGF